MSQRPLSKEQRRQLGIIATQAFAWQEKCGLVQMPADMAGASKSARAEFWRHQEIAACTQRVCTIRDAIDDEYSMLKLHFEALCGAPAKGRATQTAVRVIEGAACHRAPGCEYVRQMRDWMAQAGYADGYMIVLMKAKFRGITDITRLSERQLKMLHDTIVNRARAKLGKGERANRNKSQRARPESPSSATAPSSKPGRTYVLKPRPDPASKPNQDDNEPF